MFVLILTYKKLILGSSEEQPNHLLKYSDNWLILQNEILLWTLLAISCPPIAIPLAQLQPCWQSIEASLGWLKASSYPFSCNKNLSY